MPLAAGNRSAVALVALSVVCALTGFALIIFGGFGPRFSANPGTWLCALALVLMLVGMRRMAVTRTESGDGNQWGWRQRARSPMFPSSAVSGAMVGGAGVVLADGPWSLVVVFAAVFAVMTAGFVLVTLPPWPTWKDERPQRTALFLAGLSVAIFLGAVFIRLVI